ncbi:unnamed protein product [marine sediment metagenome]|uniref:Uncharacterized protein n=1 Tax=marine sediment metagenome TaxID=412755 RepID=X0YA55_9ZZZZ
MPQLKLDIKIDDIESLIFQLPAEQFIILAHAIIEKAETLGMMKLSETGFKEWNEKGEDIYDDA